MKKRKKKRILHRLLSLFAYITVLAVIVAVFLCFSPFFDIAEIKVTGSTHYSGIDIIQASGIQKGVNGFRHLGMDPVSILDLRLKDITGRLQERFPYILKADALFKPLEGNTVLIRITERKPVMLVTFLGTSLLVDESMYVVDTADDVSEVGLPIVEGLGVFSYKLGYRLELDNADGFKRACALIDAVDSSDAADGLCLSDHVGGIDVTDAGNTFMNLDSRIKVNLGDMDKLQYRIDYLKQIFFKHIKQDDTGVIDFTSGDNPLFIK